MVVECILKCTSPILLESRHHDSQRMWQAVKGGGFYITTNSNVFVTSNSSSSVEIKDSVFDSNTAIREGGHGPIGGLCKDIITLSGCLFERIGAC